VERRRTLPLWSDIPNNRQMRWMEEDGHVSAFRSPSEYSNGNTFDYEGRQLSCQHGSGAWCASKWTAPLP
jgi:sugar lactone lactonase YvrE